MAFTDYISRILTLRRLLKIADRIAAAQERQAAAQERLADFFAPVVVEPSKADLKESGPSWTDLAEQGRVQEFVERCVQDVGREPTEEEIERFLDGEEVRL